MIKMVIKRWTWVLFRFAIVATIFVYLYKTGQFKIAELKSVLDRQNLFVAAAMLIFLGALISVQRWRLLMKGQDIFIGFGLAFKLSFIGYFFSAGIPGVVSGDIMKAYYLAKGQEQKAVLVTTVIFDRLFGLYTMLLVATLVTLFTIIHSKISGQINLWSQPSIKVLGVFIFVLFFFLTSLGLIFMSKRLRRSRLVEYIIRRIPFQETVSEIYDAVYTYGQKPMLTLNVLLLSLVAQFPLYVGIWCLSIILKIKVLTFINYLFALPVCLLINAIPLAPGGLGVGEAGFRGIFLLFGSNKGAELAVLFHAIFFILALGLGGLVYLFSNLSREEPRGVNSNSKCTT